MISGGDLGQRPLKKFSSTSWTRSDVFSCAPRISFGEIIDSVVRCARGELVRGSDPPLVYSACTAAGDVWRAPTRLLLIRLAAGVWKTEAQTLYFSQRAKRRFCREFDKIPQDNAGNLSRSRAGMNVNS